MRPERHRCHVGHVRQIRLPELLALADLLGGLFVGAVLRPSPVTGHTDTTVEARESHRPQIRRLLEATFYVEMRDYSGSEAKAHGFSRGRMSRVSAG